MWPSSVINYLVLLKYISLLNSENWACLTPGQPLSCHHFSKPPPPCKDPALPVYWKMYLCSLCFLTMTVGHLPTPPTCLPIAAWPSLAFSQKFKSQSQLLWKTFLDFIRGVRFFSSVFRTEPQRRCSKCNALETKLKETLILRAVQELSCKSHEAEIVG